MDKYKSDFLVEVYYHLYQDNVGDELISAKNTIDELNFRFFAGVATFMSYEKVYAYACGHEFSGADKETQNRMLFTVDEGLEVGICDAEFSCVLRDQQTVINWDGSVALCCVTYNPEFELFDDYCTVDFSRLNIAKTQSHTCSECIKYGIKGYALNSPYDKWHALANQKLAIFNSKLQFIV